MLKNTKDKIYLYWTVTVYECYLRNCICKDCRNQSYCRRHGCENRYQIPNMKYTVLKLWENLGAEGLRKFEERYQRNKQQYEVERI